MNLFTHRSPRFRHVAFTALFGIALSACGPVTMTDAGVTPRQSTRGTTTLLTPDDSIAVSIQRDENVITVFNVVQTAAGPQMLRTAVLEPGAGSEPWAGVIGNDGNTAYVILRHAQEVVEVVDLRGTPHLGRRASTESEPTGIAITPSGASLYIANWNQGTISKIGTADMNVDQSIDLNQALIDTNLLGAPASMTARAGFAHPRGIVISDSGDANDADETAYVTEFFSQGLPASEIPIGEDGVPVYDQSRVGIVYAISLATRQVRTVRIAPVAATGFLDSRDRMTGCVPNQLQAPTLHDGKLYVTSTCASPDGPTDVSTTDPSDTRNFKTLMHPVVFVIDTTTNPPAEVPNSAMVLSHEFQMLYDRIHESDAADNPFGFQCDGARRRIPLMPTELAFVPGTNDFYVSSYGTNAVFRVSLDAAGRLASVGRDEVSGHLQYVELVVAAGGHESHLPTGFAIGNTHTEMMLVSGDHERNVAIVSLAQHIATDFFSAVAYDPSAVTDEERDRREGRRFFASGTGRWGYRAQGWSSCEGCHPDGLTDNVTWFFRRGPRQAPSLAGTYGSDGTRRMMSWTASFDEVQDLESVTRHLQGGVGSFVFAMSTPALIIDRLLFEMTQAGGNPTGLHATPTPQDFLNGSSAMVSHGGGDFEPSVVPFYDYVKAYVETIRAPRPPLHIEDLAATGREIFRQHGCQGCHGGERWTVSQVFYQPNESFNNPISGSLRHTMFTLPAGFPATLSPVLMRGGGTAPLRYTNTDATQWTGNDQLNCALRDVGTFQVDSANHFAALAPAGVAVNELRHNMTGEAQGADGFNPPSLVGLGTGAPYFHAGNARTLEELLVSDVFDRHTRAMASAPIAPGEVAPLVAFLLSIDKHTESVPLGSPTGIHVDLCR